MTKIRLIYFNARGRAELSRLILAQAGQEYEDVRITKDEWPAMKPGNTYLQPICVLHYDKFTLFSWIVKIS